MFDVINSGGNVCVGWGVGFGACAVIGSGKIFQMKSVNLHDSIVLVI